MMSHSTVAGSASGVLWCSL